MKHIIYIPKELYKNIVEDNCSMREMQILLRVIKNGTPFEEELEKVREEIKTEISDYEGCADFYEGIRFGLRTAIEIIDKHISELKGDNE